jgi:thiol:disulfide interchange protein
MHATTFRDPAVVAAAAGVRFFRVDMTTPTHYLALVQKSFAIFGEPTVIVFGQDGKERTRRFGFIPSGDFLKMLELGRTPAPAPQ